MKHVWRLGAPAAVGLLLLAGCERGPTSSEPAAPPEAAQTARPDRADGPDRHIVVLRDGADPAAVAAGAGVQPRLTYRYALTGFSAPLPDAARRALAANPRVRWIEPVRTFQIFEVQRRPSHHKPGHRRGGRPNRPNQSAASGCAPGPGDATTHDDLSRLWGIRRINAPQSETWTDEPVAVDVAILDTGADLDHPDLCVHRARSFDFLEPTPEDYNGHGTHVAGTTAARDDNGLVVGVAPEARLWVAKICNFFGFCFGDAIVGGIDWVAQRADTIAVANMSLGGTGSDQQHARNDCEAISDDAMHAAICGAVRQGVTFVVAAGNDGSDASTTVPAAYDEVVTVSAMDSLDNAASFSNHGPEVDLIAPGVDIVSDAPGGGTQALSGTSMASPHVAGGAGLFIARELAVGAERPSPFAVRDSLVARGQAWAGQGGLHPEPLLDVSTF